ncbi:MAG: LysE family translocator [Pseudomonadota bacterium]
MLTFMAAVFFLLITPGPGVLTTAGVGAGFGFKAGARYTLGIVAGTVLVMILIASGLAAVLFTLPGLRIALLIGSTLYLLWIAYKVAASGNRVGFMEAERAPQFHDGFLLSLINPKGFAVFTTLFSSFPLYPDNLLVENVIKGMLFVSVSLPVHFLWLYAGISLKRLAPSEGTARAINYAMAAALVVVVLLAVGAQL